MKYEEITIEECFTSYHKNKTACECDGDNKEIKFMEE